MTPSSPNTSSAKYLIKIFTEPDGKVHRPPLTQYYDAGDREKWDKDAAQLKKRGFRIEKWIL